MPRTIRFVFILAPLILFAYLYVGGKFHRALLHNQLLDPVQAKLVLIGLLVFLNLQPVLMAGCRIAGLRKTVSAAMNGNRIWDLFLGYPYWTGAVWLAEIAPWILAMDFLKLPFYPLYAEFNSIWLDIEYRITLALVAFFTLYVVSKIIVDTVRIRVSSTLVTFRNLPLSLDGLKVVHISDLHMDSRTRKRRVRRLIRKVNRCKPDVIFFTGDLVTSSAELIDEAAFLLAGLQSRYGIYACLGDHDRWVDEKRVQDSLFRNGIRLLQDANHFISLGNDSLLVTFVTNTYQKRPNLDKLNYLMGQQPRGVLDIILMHQPREETIELAAERGYHMLLAGHTHGGQIVFRLFGITIALPRLENPYYRGATYVERMLVSVNSGLGFSLAPIRYSAPAEVSFLKINRRPG